MSSFSPKNLSLIIIITYYSLSRGSNSPWIMIVWMVRDSKNNVLCWSNYSCAHTIQDYIYCFQILWMVFFLFFFVFLSFCNIIKTTSAIGLFHRRRSWNVLPVLLKGQLTPEVAGAPSRISVGGGGNDNS